MLQSARKDAGKRRRKMKRESLSLLLSTTFSSAACLDARFEGGKLLCASFLKKRHFSAVRALHLRLSSTACTYQLGFRGDDLSCGFSFHGTAHEAFLVFAAHHVLKQWGCLG